MTEPTLMQKSFVTEGFQQIIGCGFLLANLLA